MYLINVLQMCGMCAGISVLFCALCVNSGRLKRIIGGDEVPCGTQIRVASLRNSTSLLHLCGATLLSSQFALTAAHCVSHYPEEYILQLNNYCVDGNYPRAEVIETKVHSSYDRYSRAHDIAVIRVSLDVDSTTWLNSSVLPGSSFGLSGHCTMYGYGSTETGSMEPSDKLLAGEIQVVSLDKCVEALGPYMAPKADSGMLCAMGDGVDSCQGDSGSPLVCNGLVQAVGSYGISCGVPGLPGVYTSVGPHLNWIQDILKT